MVSTSPHFSINLWAASGQKKMWVLLIKIVVTKYPRDKWYQFNAGNILRIQQREGKTITRISPAVSKHPTLTLWVHCSLSLISNTKSARSLNTFNTTSALNTNIFITSVLCTHSLCLWEHSVFSPSTPRVKSPLRLSNSNTLDAPSLHLCECSLSLHLQHCKFTQSPTIECTYSLYLR